MFGVLNARHRYTEGVKLLAFSGHTCTRALPVSLCELSLARFGARRSSPSTISPLARVDHTRDGPEGGTSPFQEVLPNLADVLAEPSDVPAEVDHTDP